MNAGKVGKKAFLVFLALSIFFLVSINLDDNVSSFFSINHSKTLDLLLSMITNFGILTVVLFLIPCILLYKKNNREIVALCISSILATVVCIAIKIIVARPRPLAQAYKITGILEYSFPSLHAAFVFSLAAALIFFIPKKKYLWISIAVLASFSRIYFNVHYLSDVLFGAMLGILMGLFSVWIYENHLKK